MPWHTLYDELPHAHPAHVFTTANWQPEGICRCGAAQGDPVHVSALDVKRDPFHFISSYQGEVDFHYHAPMPSVGGEVGRLSFRRCKVPWLWGYEKDGRSYWNFRSEEEFEQSGPNAWHGLLRHGCEPVPRGVLEEFRYHHCPAARTGFYDYREQRVVILDEAPEEWIRPASASYRLSQGLAA